ncbi:NAD(P)H-dependent flavin oxidoreductase YrpB (nitropropane dioxygenase family) [Hypnocyclicus thermotrophus]|uniref:NAD(P)H-dependent flavin oxidoreductase YrpB (Nitropropane dioxygenase family) n=1 Tax=Hypnocyclicus thermotrophus TaxID=1627895 RepID=A0AA46DYV7_9FUSO|nr:nitronate monooxygenase [Hypnocyclicus thermotrophus]TDT70450.1 NAD(P)H-dependent flavin oxidoreductase YrpB (nitropropane dioxygenase family) [Hypnocyclicus thermotrophus]
MRFPKLKIADLDVKIPIVQGGMAVKASLSNLAAAVANEGGIGLIAGSALPLDEVKSEIRKAREMTNGIIGINVMFAVTEFKDVVITAMKEGIDLVVCGAGFSRDVFQWGKEYNVPVVPIVSSVKLAKLSQRLGASAIVVEGGNAGGHLGTDDDSWDIVKEIKEAVKIPVIGAGGVVTPEDAKRMFDLGVDGIQMGTRFVATYECNVSEKFKQIYVNAKEGDVVRIDSPAGLPANAIKTRFVERLFNGEIEKPRNCDNCLKHCNHEFCVKEKLLNAHAGNLEDGLYFSGKDVYKVNEIVSVKEVFDKLKAY